MEVKNPPRTGWQMQMFRLFHRLGWVLGMCSLSCISWQRHFASQSESSSRSFLLLQAGSGCPQDKADSWKQGWEEWHLGTSEHDEWLELRYLFGNSCILLLGRLGIFTPQVGRVRPPHPRCLVWLKLTCTAEHMPCHTVLRAMLHGIHGWCCAHCMQGPLQSGLPESG